MSPRRWPEGFFAIFAYSLLVLAGIHAPTPVSHDFYPTLSVTLALGPGFLGLALLLIFIHHTGQVIQVAEIAARIAAQTLQALDHPYPLLTNEVRADEVTSHLIQSWRIEEKQARILWKYTSQHLRNICRSLPRLDIMQEEIFVSSQHY